MPYFFAAFFRENKQGATFKKKLNLVLSVQLQ